MKLTAAAADEAAELIGSTWMIVEHHVKVSSGQRQWWADCCWLVVSHSVCSLQLCVTDRYEIWHSDSLTLTTTSTVKISKMQDGTLFCNHSGTLNQLTIDKFTADIKRTKTSTCCLIVGLLQYWRIVKQLKTNEMPFLNFLLVLFLTLSFTVNFL